MKYAYASRTGNVEEIVNSLGIDALRIDDGSENMDEPYIQGVVCSGDTGYGDAYCQAADKISDDYGCEILYKVENSGTPEDIENIKKVIGA